MLTYLTEYNKVLWDQMTFEPFAKEPINDTKNAIEGFSIKLEGWLASAPKSCIGVTITIPDGMTQTTVIGSANIALNTVLTENKTSNPNLKESYYVVDLGENARDIDWQMPFFVNEKDVPKSTGTWVFSKAKIDRKVLK